MSVHTIAKECLEASGGDWRAAAEMMLQRVAESEELQRELTQPLLKSAVWQSIRAVAQKERRAFKADALGQPREPDQDGLVELAASNARNLLDYPLMKGMRLGDADMVALTEEIELHHAQAQSFAIKARWLSLVQRQLQPGETVREKFSHTGLAALMRRAHVEHGVAEPAAA